MLMPNMVSCVFLDPTKSPSRFVESVLIGKIPT